jgi:hypothetical protein
MFPFGSFIGDTDAPYTPIQRVAQLSGSAPGTAAFPAGVAAGDYAVLAFGQGAGGPTVSSGGSTWAAPQSFASRKLAAADIASGYTTAFGTNNWVMVIYRGLDALTFRGATNANTNFSYTPNALNTGTLVVVTTTGAVAAIDAPTDFTSVGVTNAVNNSRRTIFDRLTPPTTPYAGQNIRAAGAISAGVVVVEMLSAGAS